MILTLEQVTEMAPDAGSAAAGKKLMALKHWEESGRSPDALWGMCRGSAVYQVKVDFANLGYHCSCPSRKFPCKHVLGLLMLWAGSPDAVAETEAPEWVVAWLERRREREEKKAERQDGATKKPVDEKAQQRRAQQRESRVEDGLARLCIWMSDLVRGGLAGVQAKPPSFWEDQARRLVDAQAPGLASRVGRLADIPRSSPDWPARLLAELGKLRLLLYAWGRIGELDPALQCDVRQLIGWTVTQEELERDGERVTDTWVVIGQWIDDDDRIRAQRSWLVGRTSGWTALVLQFSAGGQAFAESILPGSEQEATLVFYPGAVAQRARLLDRAGNVKEMTSRPPGTPTVEAFLGDVAASVSRQPWLSAFGVVLQDVTLALDDDIWWIRDRDGMALPLVGRECWRMLAVTGGQTFDMAGEWDGSRLRPLGWYMDTTYRVA